MQQSAFRPMAPWACPMVFSGFPGFRDDPEPFDPFAAFAGLRLDGGASSGGGGGGASGGDPARIASLEAELRQIQQDRKQDLEKAREAEQKKLQKALDDEKAARAKAEKDAKEQKDALATRETEWAAQRKADLVWERLRSGKIKDGDKDDAKAIRLHDDRDLMRLLDLDKVEVSKDGKLPDSFDATARGWAKASPTRFQVGEAGDDDDGGGGGQSGNTSQATGGGTPPGSGRPRSGDAGKEDERLSKMAETDFAALYPNQATTLGAGAGAGNNTGSNTAN